MSLVGRIASALLAIGVVRANTDTFFVLALALSGGTFVASALIVLSVPGGVATVETRRRSLLSLVRDGFTRFRWRHACPLPAGATALRNLHLEAYHRTTALSLSAMLDGAWGFVSKLIVGRIADFSLRAALLTMGIAPLAAYLAVRLRDADVRPLTASPLPEAS